MRRQLHGEVQRFTVRRFTAGEVMVAAAVTPWPPEESAFLRARLQ